MTIKTTQLTTLFFIIFFVQISVYSQVGIGTTNPDPSSLLDITSTTQGILVPRMTEANKIAISSPANGLLLYQTDGESGFYYYSHSEWLPFASEDKDWTIVGNDMYNANSGKIGINTTTPDAALHIAAQGPNAIFSQGFEVEIAPFTQGGNADWTIDMANANEGSFSAVSGSISNNQTSSLSYIATIPNGGANVSFDFEVSSERRFDEFEFIVNGTVINSWSGELSWLNFSYNIPTSGNYTLTWRYRKDGSDLDGDDLARIDNVQITTDAPPTLRIQDGNELAGRVLTSDAQGYASWSDITVSGDDDWRFHSGSSFSNDVYRLGKVTIGTNDTTLHLLDVENGFETGTEIGLGSREFIRDGVSETFFDQTISPLSDALYNLGSASNRWNEVYAFNGLINTSDASLKEDIEPLNYGLKEIMKLKPVSYKWKNEHYGRTKLSNDEKEVKLGFLAQDLQEVLNEVVVSHSWKITSEKENKYVKVKNDKLGVVYSEIIPVAVKAIQEQQTYIEDLKSEMSEMKKEMQVLKEMILSNQKN